jgi:signal transduction histidine kinase
METGKGMNEEELRRLLHKLNNPLSVISGFAEYLLTSLPEDDPSRKSVEEIFANAKRLRDIIDEAHPLKGRQDPAK